MCYYQDIFNPEEAEHLKQQCREARIGCVDCKKICIEKVNLFLEPLREKRNSYARHMSQVEEILQTGDKKAQYVATETLHKAKNAIGV